MNILEPRPITPAQPLWPVAQRPLEDNRLYGPALVRTLLIILLLMATLGAAVSLPLDESGLVWFLSDCFAIVGCLGLLGLLGRGHTQAAACGTIGMIFVCITAIHPFRPIAFGIEVAGYGLVVALTGALLSRRSLVLMTLASVAAIIWAGSLRYPGGLAHPNAQFDVLTYSMLCASVACVLFFSRRGSSIVLRHAELDAQMLAQQVAQRTAEMAANEHYFEALINASLDAIIFVDPSNKIQYESPALETLLGYKAGERLGRDVAEFGHPDDLPHIQAAMRQQLAGGSPGPGLNVRARHALGHWVDTECTGKFVRDKNSNAVLGMVVSMRDITLRKQSEMQLERQIAIQQLVADVSNRIASGMPQDIDANVQYALQRLGEFTSVDITRLFFFNPDGKESRNTHEWVAPGIQSQQDRLQDLRWEDEWWVRQFQSQQIICFDTADMAFRGRDPFCAPNPDDLEVQKVLQGLGVQSALGVALLHDGKVVGELALDTLRSKKQWSAEEISLVQLVAEALNSALSRKYINDELQHRLAFEKLVAETSNRFMSIAPEQTDGAIQDTLQQVGEFMHTDYCRLFLINDDNKGARNTHEWTAEGVPPRLHLRSQYVFQESDFVWFDYLHQHRLIYFMTLDEMPPELEICRLELQKRGPRSRASVSLWRDDTMIGTLSLDVLRRQVHFTQENIRLLQVVAEIISNALNRKHSYEQIQHRLSFERLISNISTQFNAAAPHEVDQAIHQAMQQIGTFSGMDVARLFLIAEDGQTVNNTHEWAADEADLRQQVLQNLPMQDSGRQYLYERLVRDGMVHYDNVAEMPLEFGYLRTAMTMLGVRNFINVLLRRGDEVLGDLGLSSQRATIPFVAENLQMLRVVGELISNVLVRKQATDKLSQLAAALEAERNQLEHRVAERTKELSQLLEVAKTINLTLDLPAFISIVLQSLKAVIPVDAGGIWEIMGENQLRELLRYNSESYPAPLDRVWTYDPEQDIHLREMITRQVPVVIADVHAADPFSIAHRRRWLRVAGRVPPSVRASMYVPLVSHHRVTGFIALHSATPGFFDEPKVTLAQAFASQVAISMENALLHEQKVHGAAMAERSRIARELHDSVSQALFGVVLGTRTAIQLAGNTPSSDAMAYVLKLAEAALAEMRALIYELRPESLETEGLISALRRQATALSARHNLDVDLQLDDDEPMLPIKTKEALYRIGVEAVQNTIKHALATRVILTLRTTPQDVVLQVQDNGRGFDLAAANPGHFGLVGMRERAENLGAHFHLQSEPGQGTCIQIRIPLVPSVSGRQW